MLFNYVLALCRRQILVDLNTRRLVNKAGSVGNRFVEIVVSSAAEFHEPHCETALELTGHGLGTTCRVASNASGAEAPLVRGDKVIE